MAQHYEVKDGETLVINGPANIIVKTGVIPTVGDTPDPPENPAAASKLQKTSNRRGHD